MKKVIFTAALTCALSSLSFSQQRAQYTQYMVNSFTLNPAVAGSEDFIDAKLGYRAQWVGFEGAPRTFYFTTHAQIGKDHSQYHNHYKGEHKSWHGLGAYIFKDETGPLSRTAFNAAYAYHVPLTKDIKMSVGIFGGFKQYSLDASNLIWETTPVINPILGGNTKFLPDLSFGGLIYSSKYYFGFSGTQLFQNPLFLEGQNGNSFGKLDNHYFISGGMVLPFNYDWYFAPSFMVKVVTPAPVSVDLNAKLRYKDLYWAGLSYRVRDSFSLIFGTTINEMIDVSYSYDLTTSNLYRYNTGSHEIVLGLRLKYKPEIRCATPW